MYFLKDTGRLDRDVVEVEGCDHSKYLFEVNRYLPAVCLHLYETVNIDVFEVVSALDGACSINYKFQQHKV